ncbi:MAG: hypothetical protein V7K82_15465 [Nostoc sp.]
MISIEIYRPRLPLENRSKNSPHHSRGKPASRHQSYGVLLLSGFLVRSPIPRYEANCGRNAETSTGWLKKAFLIPMQ